jgi:hypothetical protein
MKERPRRNWSEGAKANPILSEGESSPLPIGARIKMSLLGLARNPHLAERQGTIIGCSRLNGSVRVLFDRRKTPVSLHRNYIEPYDLRLD